MQIFILDVTHLNMLQEFNIYTSKIFNVNIQIHKMKSKIYD